MSRCQQFWKPARIFAKWSLGLGFLGTETRARILLKLSSLGLGFSNKGLGVSASLGFYHSPPLPFAREFGASYKPLTFILSVWVNWNGMQMWKDLVSLGVIYIWWRFSWNSNCFYYVLTRNAYQIFPKWVIFCKELVVKCLLPIACVLCGSPQFRESWDPGIRNLHCRNETWVR